MNVKAGVLRSYFCAAALCVAGTALLPLQSVAADGSNLQGTWKLAAPQTSFKPEGGAIPFTAEGKKSYEQNKRHQAKHDYDSYDYAMARCSSPGVPRLMITPERFRLWQRPGLVMFQFEWNRVTRQVDMGSLIPQPRVAKGQQFGGDDDAIVGRASPIANGRWEGDTLVATTEGFAEYNLTLIDDLVPHGGKLKVTERFRLRDSDTLENRITIEDPEYFTRPWQTTVVYKRQPDAPFREDVCLERLKAGKSAL